MLGRMKLWRPAAFLFSLVFAFSAAFGCMDLSSHAEDLVASGSWKNLSWKVDTSGKLTISGSGKMADGEDIEYGYPWISRTYGIKSLVVKEGVSSLATRAFSGLETLESVWLPDSLRSIGDGAFYDCGFESVNIPTGVNSIGEGPFAACKKLKVITVSPWNSYFMSYDGVLYSKDRFRLVQCPANITGEYEVDAGTGVISRFAFQGCKITNIILPENLLIIEYGAFSDCLGLTDIVIPEGVYLIDQYGFNNCSNLSFVTLPTTLTHVGAYAFNGDGPILAVSFKGTEYQWKNIYIGPHNDRLYIANKTYFNPYDSANILPEANLKWITWGTASYWYEDGIRQGTYFDPAGVKNSEGGDVRGREIYDPASKAWYWLDSIYSGAKAVNKEVWMPYVINGEENFTAEKMERHANKCGGMKDQVLYAMKHHGSSKGGGKWVRYDDKGKMIKGFYSVKNGQENIYPEQKGNTYYYDPYTGMMARGWVWIDEEHYHFDELTGVLVERVDAYGISYYYDKEEE